jgi:hypothetical protein
MSVAQRRARDRIVQVRLDPALMLQLDGYRERLQARDPKATESMAVRMLLRSALASASGVPLSTADAGFQEGMRRGYDEVRRAISDALKPLLEKEKSQ